MRWFSHAAQSRDFHQCFCEPDSSRTRRACPLAQGISFYWTGIVVALAGSRFGKWVDGGRLISLFAVLMIVMSIVMLRSRPVAGQSVLQLSSPQLGLRLSSTGLGTGVLAGFFGVGSFGLTVALNYARSGLIDWPVAFQFMAGGVIGGWGGAQVARHLAAKRGVLNMVFASTVFLVGVYMLLG